MRPGPGHPRAIAGGGCRLGLVFALSILLGACGAGPTGPVASSSIGPASSGTPDPGASQPAASSAVSSPVSGVIVKIDSAGLSKVTGFRLRTDAGQEIAFSIGVLENGAVFPPGHLAEHMATSTPVKVYFRDEAGTLVVYRLEDAS